jgi:hypothetical protein
MGLMIAFHAHRHGPSLSGGKRGETGGQDDTTDGFQEASSSHRKISFIDGIMRILALGFYSTFLSLILPLGERMEADRSMDDYNREHFKCARGGI